MNIGLRITKIRNHYDLSQAAFAEKLNIKPANLSHMETGRVTPTILLIENIVKIFNINIEWLILGTGEMLKTEPMQIQAGNIIIGTHNTASNTQNSDIYALQHEVEMLRKEVQNLLRQLADKERIIDGKERLIQLLERQYNEK